MYRSRSGKSFSFQFFFVLSDFFFLNVSGLQESLKTEFANIGVAAEVLSMEDPDIGAIDLSDYIIENYTWKRTKLEILCRGAFILAVLLRLKLYLKKLYVLDNEKCLTYQPNNSSKVIFHGNKINLGY